MQGLPGVKHFVLREEALPPVDSEALYEFWLAGNGLFVRGRRQGLEVMFPVFRYPVPGLPPANPYLRLNYPPKVGEELVLEMLAGALLARDREGQPLEVLYYLEFREGEGWKLVVPPQEQSRYSVKPLIELTSPLYRHTLIELHSHHALPPIFSSTDDRDETGFRIYGVLGNIFEKPTLRVRVGLFGRFWEVPASAVFSLPAYLTDAFGEKG